MLQAGRSYWFPRGRCGIEEQFIITIYHHSVTQASLTAMLGAGGFDHLARPTHSPRLVQEVVSFVDAQKRLNVVLGDLARVCGTAELVEGQVDEEEGDGPEDVVAIGFKDGQHRQDVHGQRSVAQQRHDPEHQLQNVVPAKTQSLLLLLKKNW